MMMGDGPVVLMGLDLARGHAAKIERTAFLGDPPQRDVELFEAMTGAGGIAHSMVRPDAHWRTSNSRSGASSARSAAA